MCTGACVTERGGEDAHTPGMLYRTTEALPFSQNSSFGHTVTACYYYLAERLRQHLGHGEEADEEAVHKKWDQRGGVKNPVRHRDGLGRHPAGERHVNYQNCQQDVVIPVFV